EWLAAPDEPVKVRVSAKGFADLGLDVTGGATDRTVTLTAEHRITGAVTDAVTGRPIPTFGVIPVDVFRKDFLSADRGNAVTGRNGRFEYLATRTDIPLRVRVEAPGYRTQDGPEFRVGDGSARRQDFRLRPARPLAGRVVDAGGRPVGKAEVLFATPTEQARLAGDDNHRATTDAAGRFEFPDTGEPWAVVARTDGGAAFAEFPADRADAGTLTLRPWASVRGRFEDGGRPVRGATVLLSPVRVEGPGRPMVDAILQAETDPDGRFEFPRVPPGPVALRVSLGPWKDEGFRSGPAVPLDLKPGERAELALGADGAAVSGRVKLTGRVPAGLDCTYSLNYLVARGPGIAPPAAVAAAGFDSRKGWRDTWTETPEGLAYLGTLRHWFVKLSPDGSFRVSGVPAGEYDLAVAVYARPSGCLVHPLARRVVRVTVTAADAARGALEVPEVAAVVVPAPAVGDAPAVSFTRADGKAGSLADGRGKYTAVHFWASWCGPCKKDLPRLRALNERYAARGLATLSLSLDDDPAAWQAALKGLALPWPQGRVGADGASGVSGVPAYWLLDPAGRVVARPDDFDGLAAGVAERLGRPPAGP
ncbi:MAG TPA: carboxypeptidase regulatory-like domain-containing protein, partial [Urbifossiella sp.]|nr:carboxypeptidase regulatory-like domain-containing protein [Urbifossiella sp.]